MSETSVERRLVNGVWQTVIRDEEPGGALVSYTTLTSAQILDIHNTPVELVAAPGAGKVVVPLSVTAVLRFGTVQYATGGGDEMIVLPMHPDLFAEQWWTLPGGIITSGEDTFGVAEFQFGGPGTSGWNSLEGYENQPLGITGDQFTAGDGELLVIVVYAVVNIA